MKDLKPSHHALAAMEKPPVHPSARRVIQGRDYSGRQPVGAMSTQGSGFKRDTAQLQSTVPTRHVHDTSKEGSAFKRPYFDEDQHVA